MKSFKTGKFIRALGKKLENVQLFPTKCVHLLIQMVTDVKVCVKTPKIEKETRHSLDAYCVLSNVTHLLSLNLHSALRGRYNCPHFLHEKVDAPRD